ncbi:CDP-glucose 4,6-dehydratase [Clostridia bacterium]|nr:CDP-glucose 4,6-dehydratase [Clostridia bacterium]
MVIFDMVDFNEVLEFYKGKRVFLTGHTGFKGSWLSFILTQAGAEVFGYALSPPTEPSLFDMLEKSGVYEGKLHSVIGDIRDKNSLQIAFDTANPEIVIHMAAQPIVLEGYRDPAYTYETNVMGTVNILECVRLADSVKSFLNVTTDKVYENKDFDHAFRETDPLDGYDPYSNSKSCSELVTHSYTKSFFAAEGTAAISTARAGNVIGGGDFASNRIIPDCVRAVLDDGEHVVTLRNPYATRPYQHVLEPLFAYLLIAQRQYADKGVSGNYNVGPLEVDCVDTFTLVDCFAKYWNESIETAEEKMEIVSAPDTDAPHEAHFLKLDCSYIAEVLGWTPRWHVGEAVQKTVAWTKAYKKYKTISDEMKKEMSEYLSVMW